MNLRESHELSILQCYLPYCLKKKETDKQQNKNAIKFFNFAAVSKIVHTSELAIILLQLSTVVLCTELYYEANESDFKMLPS